MTVNFENQFFDVIIFLEIKRTNDNMTNRHGTRAVKTKGHGIRIVKTIETRIIKNKKLKSP